MFLSSSENALDYEQYDKLKHINSRSLLPSVCSNTLRTYIASAQLLFRTEDGRQMTLTQQFHKYISDNIVPFIKDCIDELLTLGIVAVNYDVIRHTGNDTATKSFDTSALHSAGISVVPYVIKGGLGRLYTITVAPDPIRVGKFRYRFYRLVDERGNACNPRFDPRVRLFTGFGFDPSADGSLCSLVSTILYQEKYIAQMYFFSLRTEQARSDNAIFIESTKNVVDPIQIRDYYADADPTQQRKEMSYTMTAEELQMLEQARQAAAVNIITEMRYRKDDLRNGVDLYESIGRFYETPIVPIPDGRRVAKVNAPNSLRDWLDINRNYQDYVCTAYGIPRHLLIGDHHRVAHDESGMIRSQFERTLDMWKRIIECILEVVYDDLFAADNLDNIFADTVVRATIKDEDKAAAKSDELVQYRRKVRSQVNDAVTSYISTTPDAAPFVREITQDFFEQVTKLSMASVIQALVDLDENVQADSPEFALLADRLLELIRERSAHSKVKITYVSIPNVNNDDLFFLYAVGAVPWEEYQQLIRGANNLPVRSQATKDPWHLEARRSMLQRLQGEHINKLGDGGNAIFSSEIDNNENNNNNNTKNSSDKTKTKTKTKTARAKKQSSTDGYASDSDSNDDNATTKQSSKNKSKRKRKHADDTDDSDDDESDKSKKRAKPDDSDSDSEREAQKKRKQAAQNKRQNKK